MSVQDYISNVVTLLLIIDGGQPTGSSRFNDPFARQAHLTLYE
jgi:hypothetical protein